MNLLPKMDVLGTAYFVDFDGTLAEIVDHPERVKIAPRTLAAVGALAKASGNALAVISGRSVAQLDTFLHPLKLPLAGVHGMERRLPDGRLIASPVDRSAQRALHERVHAFSKAHPGVLAEPKPGSVAIHYRNRPDLASACEALADTLAQADPRLEVLAGKMVVELKLGSATKADAIAAFMDVEPFRGRLPFFAGDDVTDEAGFDAVNALGGVSVKVGNGKSSAKFRVANTALFTDWIERLAEDLKVEYQCMATGCE